LLRAAKRLEPLDLRLARETYLEALSAAIFAGRLATGGGVLEVAEAARAAPPAPHPPRAADLLLDGLALLVTEAYPAGAAMLKRVLAALRGDEVSREEEIRLLWVACHIAHDLWDYDTWHALSIRFVQVARDAGALTVLPVALNNRMVMHLHAGELATAASLLDEAKDLTEATGSRLAPYGAAFFAAWRGREEEATELIEATANEVADRGEGAGLTLVHYTSAVLYNGLGRYEDALAAAEQASAYPQELGMSTWGLVELIEAASRTGNAEPAADALQRLSKTTRASGGDWALGLEARSRALLSDDHAAELHYREAIDRLGRTPVRLALARAHLLYGEWLRRQKRRLDAREQLRTAQEMLTAMGVEAFAQRAERELLASGEAARKRTAETTGGLTVQETHIARLARDGLSNPEIGAQLFISPRTVQYHLHKVFAKLEISSRTELERALPLAG